MSSAMNDHSDMSEKTLPTPTVPDKVTPDGLEEKWGKVWEDSHVYAFDEDATRDDVYSIDTPPPTVSGSLHVGHVFSYTHTDVMARYKRMTGRKVFYPMGWDDNGLPTERRVQNYYGVRCDPSLPYDPNFTPPYEGGEGKSIKNKDQVPISRRNFVELCEKLTVDDEKSFEDLWRRLGLSVDWKHNYQTIGENARRIAQTAFLRSVKRGEAYQSQAPGLWDVTFQTAVAQAELESREYDGFYHSFAFHLTDGSGDDIIIETTRPELLGACCALVAHPDDERYKPLFGKHVTSPGFDVEIPVLAHPEAEMDKGSGIAMCCTFGDVTDVDWWRDLDLPTRVILRHDGRIITDTPDWITSERGRKLYEETAGKTTFSARKVIVDALQESGEMIGEPKKTKRMTNFFEKGDKPLEIVMSRQWYIRNGGSDFTRKGASKPLNEELLDRGKDLLFHPDFMRVRYENWVNGLNTDWLISRQRFFGVPIPLWYKVTDSGEVDFDALIIPDENQLPIDPTSDVPAGYDDTQRDQPGGFHGEVDIMDTWATSSLTPQIAAQWLTNDKLFNQVYPMDLRPQGQDIIRTWLFSTVLRAHLEFGGLPWKHAAISGWILDPDRKKMSKSKGNVVTPMGLLEKHGSDAVRYWAAAARLGTDSAFDEGQMKIGRRLAMKLLNASKFAMTMGGEHEVSLDLDKVTKPIDKAIIAKLADVITQATKGFDEYDHARALDVSEKFFWEFCDDYLEVVKARANNFDGTWDEDDVLSARTALAVVIDNVVRLLAPYIPYSAEEVWSWYRKGSVHTAPWPTATTLDSVDGDKDIIEDMAKALIELRRIKSDAKVPQRTPILKATLTAPQTSIDNLEAIRVDLESAIRMEGDLVFVGRDDVMDSSMEVSDAELGETPPRHKK